MLPTQGTAQDVDAIRVLAVLSIVIIAKHARAIVKLVINFLLAAAVVLIVIGILTVVIGARL
jgi:hypothetical protein